MASLKYRCLKLNPITEEVAVAASQYFRHNGINLVYLDGSGHATLALTATATLYGYAIVPKGRGAGSDDNYWKSSATAGKDKIQVVTVSANADAKFLLPAGGTAIGDTTVTESMKGNACDIVAVNDGTATFVDVDTSSTDVLLIVGVGTEVDGGAATDVIVKFNIAKVQADT
ncbi:MAG: hypothetical protein WC974_09070 [Thermoplasmata archaeon]